ncbi:MAG: efflux RND transporter periplasmic adaptor subunit [Gemmataceae bacterium]
MKPALKHIFIHPASLLTCLTFALAGCARAPAEAAPVPAEVSVSHPIEREVTEFAEYTARMVAVDSVEVRARVWGYLDKVNFKEGAIVKKGDVLFEIDPLTYRAALNQAEGNLASAEARVERLTADLARARRMLTTGAMSQEEFDKTAGDHAEAQATRAAMKAAVDRAKLDMDYTKVTAPIGGRTSRYAVTVGNLIQPGNQGGGTLLTTIVSLDPMYAYFDVDEHTALRVRQMIREGKSESVREGAFPVSLGLANEQGCPHAGTVDFVDNQVNPKTGTIRLRATFVNTQQVFLPGFFARVRMPIGRPHKALLVSERALDTDQGQRIVYLVGEKNVVSTRSVQLGVLQDGLREISEGLKAGDQVVVVGLQQIRPGATVTPKLIEMPITSVAATAPKPDKP